MISRWKKKFHHKKTSLNKKLQLLTLSPLQYKESHAAKIMGTSRYMIRKARQSILQKGILSVPNPNKGMLIIRLCEKIKYHLYFCTLQLFYSGKSLSASKKLKVKQFYESGDVMPGLKDTKSVKSNGQKSVYQKRLIMGNLKEIFKKFKFENPDVKIGFSSFATLRPAHCVLAGAGGTHSVYVCLIHENMKLIALGNQIITLYL